MKIKQMLVIASFSVMGTLPLSGFSAVNSSLNMQTVSGEAPGYYMFFSCTPQEMGACARFGGHLDSKCHCVGLRQR